jgi:hypothetical protein
MCDIGNAIGRIFTAPGTGGQEAAVQAASEDALNAQRRAKSAADTAAAGPASSEAARQAMEARLRLLLAATGGASTFAGGPIGPPSAGTKMLTGS